MVEIDDIILKITLISKKIRRLVIKMLSIAGSGHPGGSLSCVEIVTTLYFHIMRHRPLEPDWDDRDRFVLSKGHSCPTLYANLVLSGYFPEEELKRLRMLDSILQGHPDRLMTPGIEVSTGSLGQGLSCACGMALAGKIDKKDFWVYVLLGDGEIQEGQVWEAAMSASHYKLDNLIAFLDYNKFQIDGKVCDVMNIEPLKEKWASFGWYVQEIDGHNIAEIISAVDCAKKIKEMPKMIICHTIKGKGVSFMENKPEWHGVTPTKEEAERALSELV
ncbi:TPA: transketolase [bacterium]|nr:transketolase [bacterium]